MKPLLAPLAITAVLLFSATAPNALAECYGDAASMYGCGPKQAPQQVTSRGGSLERFGGDDAPVLPDTGYQNQDATASDVVTAQESRRMLRGIVLGTNRRNNFSQRTLNNAMNASGQPLRRAGAVTFGAMGGGGGGSR
jgi:hypothetical protein